MAITVRATSTGPNNLGTSSTINLPTGTVADDVTVICGGFSGATVGNSVTVPSGWTTICNANGMFAAYRKFVVADPTSVTFTTSDTSSFWETAAASFIGCDTTTPIDTSNSFFALMGIGPQLTYRAPSVAPNYNNSLLLACFIEGEDLGGTPSTPGGFSSVVAASGGPSILIASKQLSSAAQTGDQVTTGPHTNQPKMGVQIALHASGDSAATVATPVITWGGLYTQANSTGTIGIPLSRINALQNDLVCVCIAYGGTSSTPSGYTLQGSGNGVYMFTYAFNTGDPDPSFTLTSGTFWIAAAFLVRSTNGAAPLIDQANVQAGSGAPSSATLSTLTPATASEYLVAFWGDSDSVSGTFTPDGTLTLQVQIDNQPSILIMDTQPASNPTGTFTSTNSGTHAQIYAVELLVEAGSSGFDGSGTVSGVAGTGAAGTVGGFPQGSGSASGVTGTANVGSLEPMGVSTYLAAGGVVREVLETGTGIVFSGGVIREVLATMDAHVFVATVVSEVLVSTISSLVAGTLVREVLKSGTDQSLFNGVFSPGHAGVVHPSISPSGLGVFTTGRAGRPGLVINGVAATGQAGAPRPSIAPVNIGTVGTGHAGLAYLVLPAISGTGQAGSARVAISAADIGVAGTSHIGNAIPLAVQFAPIFGTDSAGEAGTIVIGTQEAPVLPGVFGHGFVGTVRGVTTQLTMDSLVVFATPSIDFFLNPALPSRPGGFDLREPYANRQPEERVPFNADDALHMLVTAQPEEGAPPELTRYFVIDTSFSTVTLFFDFIAQSSLAILVYLDGLRTLLNSGYTVDYFNRTVTVFVTPNTQHTIMIHAFGFGGTSAISDAAYLSFAGNPLIIDTPTVTSNLNVVVNGTLLTTGYSITGNQVTLASPPALGSDVAVLTFSQGASTAAQISVQVLDYNMGQTWMLVPSDVDTTPEEAGTIVEVNGLRLTPDIDYTVTNGVLTITATLSMGDTIVATLFTNAASMGIVTSVGTASPLAIAMPYNINYIIVWMNGLVLIPGIDYKVEAAPFADVYTRNAYGSGLYSQSSQYTSGPYGGGPYSVSASLGATLTILIPVVGYIVATVFTLPPAGALVQWMVNSRLPASVRMPPARDNNGQQLVGMPTHGTAIAEPLYHVLDEYVSFSPFTGGALAAELQPDDVTITIDLFLASLSPKLLQDDPLTIPGLTPGSVWIGSERIEYFGYERTNNVVTLSQLRRGTRGTSIEEQRQVSTVIGTGSPQTIILDGVGAIEVTADRNYIAFNVTVIFGNSNITFTAEVGAFVAVALTTGYTYAAGMSVYNGDLVFSPPAQ